MTQTNVGITSVSCENIYVKMPKPSVNPKESETDDVAAEYKGAYLLISNRYDAPSEVMGAWLKRWRIEVLFSHGKARTRDA